jgi:3',5'-cyclic AMP phosphodiesterase CpdA
VSVSGKHLLTFAVIADTHMNQSEDYSSSPYPANALANARTRRVVAELNQRDLAFIVHLGDLVNPVPELPTYEAAANHFKNQVAALKAPLYLVPGNHDVGDKPVSWMPAGRVNDEHLALYESHFGRHYFAFDHGDLHFIIVNAQIINSGLAAETAQRDWLEADLAASAGKRVFICIHYPPYVSNRDERSSYDNIDEPGRSWLVNLIEKYKPEAMFCGHVHNFWYDLLGETETYILPSTAFVRHDYSEFYRIGPGDQHGRNDGAKLGYFIVRLYEHGHVAENFRSYGRVLAEGETLPPPVESVRRRHVKESAIDWLGLDMRQPWAEELEITPSGAVDEFERKLARNDYPILALWEMGLRRMRVPVQDLVNSKTRRRMTILKAAGHVFQVHCYGVPQGEDAQALRAHADLVGVLEVVIGWDDADEALRGIAQLKRETGLQIYLSRVNRRHAGKHEGGRYNHLISHGFTLDEADELADFFAASPDADAIDGLMFAIARDMAPAPAVRAAAVLARRIAKTACLYIKSTSASPAESFEDDRANATRVAEAIVAAAGARDVKIILDTFADSDRGYFVRTGLVDRRYNPKLGSHVVGNLIALLDEPGWILAQDGVAVTRDGGENLILLLPGDRVPALPAGVQWIDLESGAVHRNGDGLATALRPLIVKFPPPGL